MTTTTSASLPVFPARGAHVHVSKESITIRRSPLASTVYGGDVELPASGVIGWNLVSPDDLSPGKIELLTSAPDEDAPEDASTAEDALGRGVRAVARHQVNYSPGQRREFDALARQLMLLHAGYELDTGELDFAEPMGSTAEADGIGAANSQGTAGAASAVTGSSTPKNSGSSASSRGSNRPAAWKKVATPDEVPETNEDADIDGPLYGQVICVTGDVAPHDKGDIWNLIAAHGAKVSKSVTKKTSMLILGQWESMTTKEKRARELRDKGQEIRLVSLDKFLEMAGEKSGEK